MVTQQSLVTTPRAASAAWRGARIPAVGYSVLGLVGLVAVWWLVAEIGFGRTGSVPTPPSVLARLVSDLAEPRLWAGVAATASDAGQGYLWGNLAALAVAAVVLLAPPLEGVALQIAVITSCIPLTAIAPLLVLMSPTSSRATCVVLAALMVFFTTVLGALVGLRAADATSLDLVRAYGGGRWTELTKVRVVAALPGVLAALTIAAPASFVGAIIGELFLSGVDTGLGIMLMAAQIQFEPQRLWALALLSAGVAGVAYAALALITRVVTPWSAGAAAAGRGEDRRSSRGPWGRAAVALGTLLGSSAFLLVVWQLLLQVVDASPYIARTPLQVWQYLTQDPAFGDSTAADIRANLLRLLLVTLQDAGIGFGVGLTASVLLALLFALLPAAQSVFMPIAMIVRTVPLVGFAPIIYIIFGNGAVTVGLIGAIIVFFPVLITMSLGLRSASQETSDVVRVYGGSRWTALRKVGIPSALPQFFASVKIAIPGAIVAAMLYEWLFSLGGVGGQITVANAASLYGETWAIVVGVTAISIILYNLVELVEVPVLQVWGPHAGRGSTP